MAVIAKQRYKLDIAPKGGWVIVYASQHDDGAREIEFEITNQGNAFSIPASINVSVQGIKSNKSYFSHSCSYSGNIVTMALADDMTDVIGKAICVLKFTNSSNQKLATAKFILNVDSDSSSEGIIIDVEAEEIFNQMLNEIRAQAASVSADIAELQSMVGSPLVASTASAMTDHNKIYVYTGSESGYINGNWYYWNGSAWTSGGVYNAVAINIDSTPTQGSNNAVRSGGVWSAIDEVYNVINLEEKISIPFTIAGTGYIASNGNASTNSTTAAYTDYIDLSGYEKIIYKRRGVSASSVAHYDAFYDANKEFIASRRNLYNQEADGYTEVEYTLPQGTVYARFTTWLDTVTYGNFGIFSTNNPLAEKFDGLESVINEIKDTAVQSEIVIGINKYDPEKATPGYISNNTGSISSSSPDYITTDYIPVALGQSVYVNRIRDFLAYDSNKNPIASSYVNALTNNYVYTAEQDGYIRASLYVSYESSNIVAYATSKPDYEPYIEKKAVESGIHLSDTMVSDACALSGNVFNGKKWVACGDSFTAGSFTNSLTDDYTFTDAPYYGKNKVYPYFIGRRNPSMTVINEAISGSTMGAGENGVNPFSGTRYLNIPLDADYITMEFGINDSGDDVPLGTIDDATNDTFYGAWNVVLDYFIQNFPYAHIGIIVGPGMQTTKAKTYAEAEIAIAKKWGIPYINIQFESGGGKIPLMLRTSNPDVSSTVKELRNNQQYVNSNEGLLNMHPNEKAHEFESTFIEAWLRTL